MSRIFLLSTNVTTEPYPVYPLGMAIVASALTAAGHTVKQFDFLAAGQSEDLLLNELKAFAPDYVSLSLRNIDNVDSFSAEDSWYLAQGKRLVELIRGVSKAPVIVGGPAFSIMPEAILDYLGCDHGIVGEGEKQICSLIGALEQQKGVARIMDAEKEGLVGDQMHSPLLVQEFADFYLEQAGMVNLQTKRGCPYSCNYCTYPSLEGATFRQRDPKDVVDDLERFQADHGVKNIFFTDSVFNDAQGHYLSVAEELIRRDLGIEWCAFFRPQGLGRKELALLKRSGVHALELGTDAACDTTLKGLNKGLTFDEVVTVNEACVAEKIPCAHFVMFGGPGETTATVEEGLKNLARLDSCVVFAFSGLRILPGTDLHEIAIRDGVIDKETPLLMPAYYFSPEVDPDWMNERIIEAFQGRRDRVFPPTEGQKRMAVMQRFGYRGILWDKLVSF